MKAETINLLAELAANDVSGLKKAAESYGDSWKKRGGSGAFMMLARKWDRLEKQTEGSNWDIFAAIEKDQRNEGILDDITDLIRYLMLVRAEMAERGIRQEHRDNAE